MGPLSGSEVATPIGPTFGYTFRQSIAHNLRPHPGAFCYPDDIYKDNGEIRIDPMMIRLLLVIAAGIGFCLLGLAQPVSAAKEGSAEALPTAVVTPQILESKIAEVEAAADLTEDAKTKLVELYRKAMSNMETARSREDAAAAFGLATETAPAQTQSLREELDESNILPPLESLTVDIATPLRDIEQLLQKEQADLAAVDARRADFERRLTREQNRPAAISERLEEARQAQEEVAAAVKIPPPDELSPAMRQANRWVLDTRYAALSAEIKMLDQELLSQPMRLDLLRVKRDKEVASVAWIGVRVKALSELVNRKRQLEAEQSKIEAEAERRETAGMDPVLGRLADQNAALTDDLNAGVARLDSLDQEEARAEKLAERIAADYQDVEATVETGGLAEGLGKLLAKHRKTLPDFEVYVRRARAREQQIAEVGVRRLRYREEARRIADLDQVAAEFEARITAEKTPELREKLRELVAQRRTLLQKALESDEFYLKQLRELDAAERKLLKAVRAFEGFLNEHLLWLRSTDPTGLEELIHLPDEAGRLFSSATRSGLDRLFYDQVIQGPFLWLGLLIAVALLWKHRVLVTAIEGIATRLGKPTTDRFSYTVHALALTLLAAAPLPLLFATVGWQLQVAAQGTDLSHAIGATMLRVAVHLFILRALHTICIPQGLAAAHFRWPQPSLDLLRIELDRLTWIFVPAVLIVRLAVDLNPVETGGTIARLGLLVGYATLTLFLFRVFHPKQGVLTPLRARQDKTLLFRSERIWFPLLLAYPPGLLALALAGFLYSASVLTFPFVHTLWMIIGLVLLHALAVRWLLVVRRRLAYEAAVERRQAALAASKAEEPGTEGEDDLATQFEKPEVDLAALSDESRELVKITTIATGLVGFYLIWASVFPALLIFDDINLWYYTVTADDEDKRVPVTLADLGLAFIIAIGIGVLAKRLPAVLEIILLHRFHMSAGSRYTVTTLVNYAIIAVGILLVLNTIGAQWSQLQWLVAALGVGIGFGLQEIVANFISGLIILFERPIRIGDFVTVGDTDGVVTKIRIRATTILNWDRKELLVPNKEFITGRLLNWSLSDQTTRLLISVGIAYGSNVPEAKRLLEEAADENEHVLDDPAPTVIFQAFGDNALSLVLRCFVESVDLRYPTISALNEAINDKFNWAGIVIAFPQRDLHLDMREPLRVSIENVRQVRPKGGERDNQDPVA